MPRQQPGIVPDDVPKRGLFTEPVRVDRIDVVDAEPLDDGRRRAAFRVTIRDREGRRCPDLAVEARITGPERTSAGMAHTDLMGQVTFRMAGPRGVYTLEVLDVAAGGLTWARDADGDRAETVID